MTTHTAVKPAERVALPRALVGRRPFPEYQWDFELGDRVEHYQTTQMAVVVGRSQILGELDNFLIQIVGDAVPAFWVKEFEIQRLHPAAISGGSAGGA
jgi:hypothetical protein